MNAPAMTMIAAEVADTERSGVESGVGFLARAIKAARPDDTQQIGLAFSPPGYDVSRGKRIDIYIASMLPEILRPPEPRAITLARWSERIRKLQDHIGHVFLCTIFRHVASRTRDGARDETLARIRMLNLLVADLSQSLDVNVIDIDCGMASFGARQLATDHTLQGPSAAVVAGHTIAAAILGANLDDLIDGAVQDSAQRALGGTSALARFIFRPQALQPNGAGHDV